jgi:hypothetical protein
LENLMMLTRRTFLGTAALRAAPQARPIRIAIIATIYRLQSHAQHMGDRFLVGYPYGGVWRKPNVKVVSLYVDQKPEGDLSGARAKEFGFQIYPGVGEALCCGGRDLAVDAVLIIAEHGSYPRNEKGQILYPRFEFFQECVRVFEASGRAVPVYNDKHLSYSFEKAKAMVETARRLRFPVLAGSSLPVTWRLPPIELPLDCDIAEALMVGEGASDPMDFHALEGLQCMVERRRGGETGVRAVQLIEGEAVWKAADEGRYSRELLTAALSRSDTPLGLTVADGRTQDLVGSGELRNLAKTAAAYCIEYRDGLKATMLMLDGAVKDFNFAARLKDGQLWSTQFLLTPDPNVTYSACLMHKAEQMFETGAAPYPVERTLLTSGILESCLTSKARNHARLETPHLRVAYKPPKESQFARS